MILQRLLAVCVILSCLFCFAPFSGFLAAGEGEAASPAPKPNDAPLPQGIEELKNVEDQLTKAIEQHETTTELLKEAHAAIRNVQKACKNVQAARENVKQTRDRSVKALEKFRASPSDETEAHLNQVEEEIRKTVTRMEVEESSLRQHIDELTKSEKLLQDEEILIHERKSVLQPLKETIQVITEFLDGKPATESPCAKEKGKPDAAEPDTAKRGVTESKSVSALPSSKSSEDRLTQRAEFVRRQVDPFFLQPLVTVIPDAEHLGDFSRQAMGDGNDSGDFSGSDCVLDYRFDHPARFPLPAYGFNGEHLEKPGVLIYEGMRLAIRPDGRYQVRFTAGAPPIPVTFQLQFQLLDQCTSQPYTLTLPPITLPTESKQSMSTVLHPPRSAFADLQTVHHEGYLPLFEDRFDFGNVVVIRRSGNARFGYGLRVP